MSAHGPVADGSADAGRVAGGPADDDAIAEGSTDGAAVEESRPLVIRRRGRRVTTEPTPGDTGEPAVERQQSGENDARLRGDVPPHWG